MTHPTPAPFPSTNSLVPAPIDQSVIDMLENSPLGPILNTPVGDVLGKLGLPPLPAAPPPLPAMPGLPPFPEINIENLFKPLTDLAQSFGSGDLGASGFDPTQLFTGLQTILQTAMGLSSGALKAADSVWSGATSTANAAKSATVAGETAVAQTKSAAIVQGAAEGAGIVGTGNVSMQAVISTFMSTVSAAMPMLATPLAPAAVTALLTAAAVALSNGIAVVTGTKATLSPSTAKQLAAGVQNTITGAPTGTSPFGIASTLLESVGSPISSLASTGSSMMGSMTKQLATANKAKGLDKNLPKKGGATSPAALKGAGKGGGGAKGGGGKGGGVGGIGAPATPLQARPGAPNLGGAATEAAGGQNAGARTVSTSSTTTSGGMMPMGGAGAAGAAGAAGRGAGTDDGHGSPDFLVTAEHGSEVVGEMPMASPSVLGGEAEAEVESPDVDLRL